MMKSITSPQNESYKRWKSLLSAKGIREEKQFLIFGEKIIEDIIRENADRVVAVLSTQSMAGQTSRIAEFIQKKFSQPSVFFLEPAMLKELDPFGTNYPLVVCSTPEVRSFDAGMAPSGPEILLPIGNPSNLGAVLRSALAFKAHHIVLLRECAHPCHPKAVRSLSANIFKLTFSAGPSIHDLASPHPVWALDTKGTDIHSLTWPKNVRIVVGEEGPGVPAEKSQFNQVRIPIAKECESLNAAIAASIALFSYRSQHAF